MRRSHHAAVTALLGLALVYLAAAAPPAASGEGGQCHVRTPPTPEQRRARRARECSHLVHEYMRQHTADFEAAHNVSKLVFFLHVPRTGGWGGSGLNRIGIASTAHVGSMLPAAEIVFDCVLASRPSPLSPPLLPVALPSTSSRQDVCKLLPAHRAAALQALRQVV